MLIRGLEESATNSRGGGQVSRLLVHAGELGSEHLTITWVECAPGSQQGIHAHRDSEQVYIVIEGSGQMIVDAEEQVVERGMTVIIPPGTPHAIRNTSDDTLVFISASSPPLELRVFGETWEPSL